MDGKSIRKVFVALSLALVIILGIAASYFRLFEHYELGALDLRFIIRPKPAVTDKIILIEIGEDTINKLGRFPFDRGYFTAIVKALSDFGARSVVFDFLFSEPSDSDGDFEAAIKSSKIVYMPFAFDLDMQDNSKVMTAKGYIAKELERFTPYLKGSGQINIAPDIDGKFRRIPPYILYDQTYYPYMPFLAACDYMGIDRKAVDLKPGKYLSCGNKIKIPLDEKSNMIINYSGKWGQVFKHYSFVDVLKSYFAKETGEAMTLKPELFKDKVCVIGLTATGTGDMHPSPFETLYPGVGIHAEVFNSVINKSFIERVSRQVNLLIIILLGGVISLVTLKTRPIKGVIGLALCIFFFTAVSILIFNIFGLWIDVVYPVFGMIAVYLSITLYKYITEWKKRLLFENELDIAKRIQESFLPKKLPEAHGLVLAPAMFAAKQVGGDLYDFIELSDGRLGVMIGDVSGKGVPASLFMAMTTGAFRFFATEDLSPDEVLKKLNNKLARESSTNLFVTMFYAIFDNAKKEVVYGNGGHLPVLYLAAGKKAVFLDVKDGMPLGLMEGEYSGNRINYSSGDIFVFYTDGITEAMNSRRDMYGKERLAEVVYRNKSLDPKELLAAIEKDVRKFEPKSTQHDDMTIITLKID